jgi:hypothetical protein
LMIDLSSASAAVCENWRRPAKHLEMNTASCPWNSSCDYCVVCSE